MDIKKRLGRKVIDAHGHIITVPTGTNVIAMQIVLLSKDAEQSVQAG